MGPDLFTIYFLIIVKQWILLSTPINMRPFFIIIYFVAFYFLV